MEFYKNITRVKICGITNSDDALAAVESGTDALGFIFYKNSPRFIDPQKAGEIVSLLPPFITTVGVFVNSDAGYILNAIQNCNINAVQLHGEETPKFCKLFPVRIIKAIRIKDRDSILNLEKYQVSAFLLDTFRKDSYGGSGVSFDWNIAVKCKKEGNIILAGGLSDENVYTAIKQVRPYGVDVSSGVEIAPGKKNIKKIKNFINEVRRADNESR